MPKLNSPLNKSHPQDIMHIRRIGGYSMLMQAAVILIVGLVFFSGCVSFPQEDARQKARLLREKGYDREARELEERAKEEPKTSIGSSVLPGTDPKYDPKNDIYHFPESQAPQNKGKSK